MVYKIRNIKLGVKRVEKQTDDTGNACKLYNDGDEKQSFIEAVFKSHFQTYLRCYFQPLLIIYRPQ